MNTKVLQLVAVGLVLASFLVLWNHFIGAPYQYGIQAGHIVKSNNNNGQMWKLQSNGWQETDGFRGFVVWH